MGKKIKYEKPVSMDIGKAASVLGAACTNYGNDVNLQGICDGGGTATNDCNPTGSTAGSNCQTGGNASQMCNSGSSAFSCTATGSSATYTLG